MEERQRVLDAFRRWGHLEADLDPLGRLLPAKQPALDISGPAADFGRRVYCGSIGAEFDHIAESERAAWLAAAMESEPRPPDREKILERLIEAETFERLLQARYVGTKRYSLEGSTALIPVLDEILDTAAELGAERAILGMSHRGRLCVLLQILGKTPAQVFGGFEDVDPRSVLGGGDVKYHLGATGEYRTAGGRALQLSLVSNPSHLEAVDPVVVGRARARQERLGPGGRARVLPILLHGDAALAGQGITAETFNMASLDGFEVGGTIHLVVNNLIGFTTPPKALQSSRYATDIARRLPIPILHVNGEDPDAAARAGHIAAEYRYRYSSEVVVDLIGYRRHGHSEVDDPTITQPLLYSKIQALAPLWESYAKRIGAPPERTAAIVERLKERFDREYDLARAMTTGPVLRELPDYWSNFSGGPYEVSLEVETAVPSTRLKELGGRLTSVPDTFSLHPKVGKLVEERRAMASGARSVDWGMAEALAFGSLLVRGTRVRLSGEDTRRGTFNHRHAVFIDVKTEAEYAPLAHLDSGQARFECYDSPLSEAAGLGFEFGFSRDFPEALVLWEAQFGDFANGAQVIIDQFVAATEDKWNLLSGLVLLLPHGYEGQGPEHSSARIERFLQLSAEDNVQSCQPSTAAQYFHLLRRQALRRWRKPLVVFTPKSLLRHPAACSPIEEFSRGAFRTVIGEEPPGDERRILLCSGKIAHELRAERRRRRGSNASIVTLEQFYPFPSGELMQEFGRHPSAREIVWIQEEPANMGALSFVLPRIEPLTGGRPVRTIKRSASASPATGSLKASALEQAALLALAFS
jgi:2-oxoglutarate dehydrogenase E1 component